MHAIYLFYIETNDIDEAVNQFMKWIDENGDENNWWMLLAGINSRHEVKKYISKFDPVLNNGYRPKTPDEIALYLKGRPIFNSFILQAWLITAYELIHGSCLKPLDEDVEEEVVKRFNEGDINGLYNYILEKTCFTSIQNQVKYLVKSVENGSPPFSPEGDPYEYRCFYLDYDSPSGASILMVDIHT